MDIHQDLVKWIREMGYSGQLPDNLIAICNNSTKYLWEQLMENVRPKQEVETIKRNIMLSRLRAKPLNKQDEFLYKIEEIEQLKRKMTAENRLKVIEEAVQEKKQEVEQLSQNCRIKYISLDVLKKKISENKQRKYLLEAKKKLLEEQNLAAKETLQGLKITSPIEKDESCNAKEISNALEKCVEKLNKHITDDQKSITQKLHNNSSITFQTVQKKSSKAKQYSVATYLSMVEKENFDEIDRSCKKHLENLKVPSSERKIVKHRLFNTPQIIIEEDSFESGFQPLSIEEKYEISPIINCTKLNKRESLGLLPDSCLLDEEADNNKTYVNPLMPNFNFKVPQTLSKEKKSLELIESGLLNQNLAVNLDLETLLHNNNRELICEVLQKSIQNVVVEFTKIVSLEKLEEYSKCQLNKDDIAELCFIHIQTELKILQQKKVMKELLAKISRRKLNIMSSINLKDNYAGLQDRLDLGIKHVALDASLTAVVREINASENMENDNTDLNILSSRILKIKTEIVNNIHLLQLGIEELYKSQKSMVKTSELILNPIWHIRTFKMDSDWMNPLLKTIWSDEMRLFESFPLNYQRRCIFTDPKTFYKDLCTDYYQISTDLSEDDLQMLAVILKSPFNPPEAILLNLLRVQLKIKALASIRNKIGDSLMELYKKKYSFEHLKKQESYLEYALERFYKLIFSTSADRTLSIGKFIKQTIDIWCEMPMKDFISDVRVFQGHNYQFYQNKLNAFL